MRVQFDATKAVTTVEEVKHDLGKPFAFGLLEDMTLYARQQTNPGPPTSSSGTWDCMVDPSDGTDYGTNPDSDDDWD